MRIMTTVSLLAGSLTAGAATEGPMRFADNGVIRVGVDLTIGGAITHVSEAGRGDNLINSHDWGRQIQMSFYSGPHNYRREGKRKSPNWGGFPWNPIQSGDCFRNGSKTLEHRAEGSTLYVKSVPMLWPMENDPGECVFETWIELEDNTFRYRGRLTNQRTDRTVYGPFHQEVPAVYTNGPWHRLMTYVGDRPFQGGGLTEVRKTAKEGWPWSKWLGTEGWAALVDDSDRGIGVWHPGACEFHGGFSGRRGKGGPKDGPTGYMSPMHTDILDPDIVYEYDCVFIVGTLDQIRETACTRGRRLGLPEWRFEQDRQGWVYRNATDGGWPPKEAWQLKLDARRAILDSPFTFWRSGAAPTLSIRAGFKTQGASIRVFWRELSPRAHTVASWQEWQRGWWIPERSLTVPIRNDGTIRDLTVDLSQADSYRGAFCGLRIELPESREGDTVRVERITLTE